MSNNILNDEKPRERLLSKGAKSLSTYELIAILLQTGSKEKSVIQLSKEVLESFLNFADMKEATINKLKETKGIGTSKACKILAAIELGERVLTAKPSEKIDVSSPWAVADYIMYDLQYLKQEHFVVLFLNHKNIIIGKKTIFIGSLDKTIAHPREIFKFSYQYAAAKIICVHNHPSGNPKPSKQDIQFTKKLMEISSLLDIPLIDHIIIGDGSYFSLKEHGII